MNKATISGFLGQDPELRFTSAGKPVGNLSVATTDYSGGEKYTTWHKVVVWGKAAENAQKHLCKGAQVLLEGRIQHRKWTDKEGVVRYTTEIHTSFVEYLGGKRRGEAGEEEPSFSPEDYEPNLGDDGVPF